MQRWTETSTSISRQQSEESKE